ncbi:hypothetical protein [Winogradskya humida]|uniref:Exo-alpha-sialidase n=1 Tax=Winogradskya humida TaxID=113566 RepID=A0ABQ3ZFF4_9ACTN|nr:hypothetical protein [Actinoplanes humidus]GIE17314.1 hypothetical protein Ahu01nite_004160 [Actinoplanes humidus]
MAALLAAGLAGCSADPPAPPSPSEIGRTWRAVELPAPQGAPGRTVLRDVTFCPGHWFAVGAVATSVEATRPAAWSSTDGRSWKPLAIEAKTYYGEQNILSSVACRDGRMAAVGAKVGGAHGNPRTSSWYETAAGTLREVTAPFELYGGPQAVNVSRLDAGPAGWLITGNRMSGAAAWTSADATRFDIHERAPGLASTAAGESWAFDGVPSGAGWLVVGGYLPTGRIDRDAAGWTSSDGKTWTAVSAADPTPDYEELQRVAVADVPVAVGVRGGRFGAWRLQERTWVPAGAFGAVAPGGRGGVRSVAYADGVLTAVTSDGVAYSLWSSPDGGRAWSPVAMPARVAAGADSAAAVAVGPGGVLLIADDAQKALIYLDETDR